MRLSPPDTFANARRTAEFIDVEGYRSVRLVTIWYTMRLSLLEFGRAMPQPSIIAPTVRPRAVEPRRWCDLQGAPPHVPGDPAVVIKRELLWVPFYGWYAARAGSIAIDRRGGAGALRRMLADARGAANDGRAIVIFPEGTRTAPGQRLTYQPGVAALYQALALPLVPAAVNSGLYWGRRSFVKRPGRIVLSFLDPIPPGLPRREVRAELETRIETATAALEAEGLAAYRAGGNQSSSLLPTI